jgi:hypothetical protein
LTLSALGPGLRVVRWLVVRKKKETEEGGERRKKEEKKGKDRVRTANLLPARDQEDAHPAPTARRWGDKRTAS